MTTFVAPPRSKIALAMREPNLLLPRKRPISRVAVDCNKSITNGLVGAWLLGPNCYDLVTGRHVTDNSVTFVTDDIGISSRVARGASAYIDTGFTASELGIGGSSSRTIIVAGQIDDDANASKPIFSMGSATSNADFTLLQTGWDTPSAYYKLELWGENIDVASSGWPARDVPNIWAVTYDQTSTYLRFYIWGALVGERTATAINTNDTYTLSFGRHANRGEEFGGRFYVAYAFNRALSDEEIREISRRWFIPLMPANQSPFLISVPAGGGVTGTGDLVGAGSEIVGTGTRTVTGTGALEGQGAAVVGTGERVITGTGALIGQGSDVAGTGATGGVHTGTGDLIGAGSEVAGVGERTVTGTGALVAQGSAVVGVGERTVIGSGDLVGAGAEVSGSGAVGGITTGTGDLVGAGSEVVGTGLRTVTGSGALVAQGSAVTGTGERTVTGAGALVGAGSEIVGAGVGGDVTTGAGALVGQGSAVTGTGKRTITGIGDLVAAGSIIVGAGVRTITGSGALVGAGSEVVGSYVEEDCTEVPSYTQFDEPVNALHEAILSQFGEDVTFSGIGLTATAVFKRYKDDVPGGGARPGVPRDVLRIKQTDICAYDVDHGTAVTVRGQAYKVISIERTKHGMTHLGIRRTH